MVEPPGPERPCTTSREGGSVQHADPRCWCQWGCDSARTFAASAHACGKDAERGNWKDDKAKITCIGDKAPKSETLKQKQHSRYVVPTQIGRMVSVIKTVGGA